MYDEIGNIIQKDGLTYSYNPSRPHAVIALSDGTTFDYDDNGNMVKETKGAAIKDYLYDTANRLTEVKKNAARVAQYEYDGDGGRVKKIEYPGGPMLTTYTPQTPCFLAGTKVLMADGSTKPIEEIKAGDQVLAYDEKSRKTSASKITQAFNGKKSNEYVIINNHLRATSEHLFYASSQPTAVSSQPGEKQRTDANQPQGLSVNPWGWIPVGRLSLTSQLFSPELKDVRVEKLEKVDAKNAVDVYDIEVETNHNYFVELSTQDTVHGTQNGSLKTSDERPATGDQFVLVHNQMSFAPVAGVSAASIASTTRQGCIILGRDITTRK